MKWKRCRMLFWTGKLLVFHTIMIRMLAAVLSAIKTEALPLIPSRGQSLCMLGDDPISECALCTKPIVISGWIGMTVAVFIHPSPDWPHRRSSGIEIMSPSACSDKPKLGWVFRASACQPATGLEPLPGDKTALFLSTDWTTCSARHYHL